MRKLIGERPKFLHSRPKLVFHIGEIAFPDNHCHGWNGLCGTRSSDAFASRMSVQSHRLALYSLSNEIQLIRNLELILVNLIHIKDFKDPNFYSPINVVIPGEHW